MNYGDKILKKILEHASKNSPLPETHEVRFELAYNAPVELVTEQQRLAELFGAERFRLEPIHEDLPAFLVLGFPGIHKQLSREALFSVAAELVVVLGVQSVIPDEAPNFVADAMDSDNLDASSTESVAADWILDKRCWQEIDQTLENDWVVDYLGLKEIWQTNQGEGITIVQPDTGVARHTEIENSLDMQRAFNVFTGNVGEATDPLSSSMQNPGHGTATSSVIASAHQGKVLGIAPKAAVVPVRCLDGVILLGVAWSRLASAIMHARDIDADVISMSLGGPFPSAAVKSALRQVVDKGAIVVAAAGNCVGIVVFPASDPQTIAVAGCGANDNAWKGTSHGRLVDISAPSENIFAARRAPGDTNFSFVKPSQGTSFGAAITAGTAALWLAHHGRDTVRAFARERGITVNELYRSALTQSARTSTNSEWPAGMGAGILDIPRLLEISLENISLQQNMVEPVTSATTDESLQLYEEVSELAVSGKEVDGFDWARYGSETLFLAQDLVGRSGSLGDALIESSAPPTMTRPLEAVNVEPSVISRLKSRISNTSHAEVSGYPGLGPVETLFGDIANLRQGGLESQNGSSARGEVEARLHKFSRSGGLENLETAGAGIIEQLNIIGADQSIERADALQRGLQAIRDMGDGRPLQSLSVDSRVGLESLVRMTGRPAFRLRDGRVTQDDPMFGDGHWGFVFSQWEALAGITASVGRVNLGTAHIGTGFLVQQSPNLIMTNRHVLEALAVEVKTGSSSHWVFSSSEASIDFSDAGTGARPFRIKRVVFTGDKPINGRVNLSALDLVVLEIDGLPAQLPGILKLSEDAAPFGANKELFVVGFPARPSPEFFVDPNGVETTVDVAKRLGDIFGIAYGRKYLSPGEVIKGTGELENDSKGWVFAHDATTLGGNSGSMIIAMGDDPVVTGIHFAGKVLTHNLAHQIIMTGAANALA